MADIRNLIDEQEQSATGYDYSIMRKYGADDSVGNALKAVGDLIEGGAKVADDAIQRNIQKDINKSKDDVEEQMGLGRGNIYEDSSLPLSTPDEVQRGFDNMNDFKEAVKQGKLSPELYELRSYALTKQLRNKYPGYREIIDQKIQSTFGIDPANSLRRNLISQIEADQTSQGELAKVHKSQLDKWGATVGNSPKWLAAQRYVSAGQPVPLELMDGVAKEYAAINGIKLQNESYTYRENSIKMNGIAFKKNLNRMTVELVKQQLQGKTLDEVARTYAQGGFSAEEKLEIGRIITTIHGQLKQYVDETMAAPAYGENGAKGFKGEYFPDATEFHSQIDTIMGNMTKGIFGDNKDMNWAGLMDMYIKAAEDDFMQNHPEILQDKMMNQIYKDWAPNPSLNTRTALREQFATVQVISKGKDLLSTLEVLEASDPNFNGNEARDIVLTMSSPEKLKSMHPDVARKNIDVILNPDRNFLKAFNPANREEMLRRLMSPEFIQNVQKYGGAQAKAMLPKFLSSSFTKIFKEDVGEFSQLANQDATGYDLTFDGTRFSFTNSAGRGIADLSTFGGIPSSVGMVNSFLTTYRNALGSDYTDEQKAEMVAEMIQRDFGASTTPSNEGGFWYKAYKGIERYLSGDEPEANTSGGVQIEPAGYNSVDEIAGALDPYEGNGRYDTLFSNSQRQFGVDVSEMTVDQALDFADGAYGKWSKGKLGYKATPMGRYQIVGSTLKSLKNELGLTGDELFDKSMQDKMFVTLLKRRGLDDYLSGKIDSKQFIRQAKEEWAGLKSRKAQRDFLAAVDRVKETMNKGES